LNYAHKIQELVGENRFQDQDQELFQFDLLQNVTILDLDPGTYSLQLILGSYVHNSKMQVNNFKGQGPFLSEKITITVN
jgi:hypothetical protein